MFKIKQIFIKVRKTDNKHEISSVKLTSYKPDIEAIKKEAYVGYKPDIKAIMLDKEY